MHIISVWNFCQNMGGQKWIPLIPLTQIWNLLIDVIQTEIFSRFEIRKCAVDLNTRHIYPYKILYYTSPIYNFKIRSAKWNISTFSYQDIGAPYYFIISVILCLVTTTFFSFYLLIWPGHEWNSTNRATPDAPNLSISTDLNSRRNIGSFSFK